MAGDFVHIGQEMKKFQNILSVQVAINNRTIVQAVNTLWHDVADEIKTLQKDFLAEISTITAELRNMHTEWIAE